MTADATNPKAPPIVREHVLRFIAEENRGALSNVLARTGIYVSDDLQARLVQALDEHAKTLPDALVLNLALLAEPGARSTWRLCMEKKLTVELEKLMPTMDAMTEATMLLLTGKLLTRGGR